MSVAFSMIVRLHHNLRLTFSPSSREVRKRLDAIGTPAG